MIWFLLAPVIVLLAFAGLAIAALAGAYRREYEGSQEQDPVRMCRPAGAGGRCPAAAGAIRPAGSAPRYSARAHRLRWP
ncbi:hypothetical protein [Bordetella petrii]|uniref:hypothetical protein n=1 Tax=Bordetella petrii TaxID=94624 RepID=UPI001A973EA5|nr:hypothetical protein [Bordetella petrii]MBO1112746.1 hypothetical protein [Bordetella petrii]